jgi:hypothetical protein
MKTLAMGADPNLGSIPIAVQASEAQAKLTPIAAQVIEAKIQTLGTEAPEIKAMAIEIGRRMTPFAKRLQRRIAAQAIGTRVRVTPIETPVIEASARAIPFAQHLRRRIGVLIIKVGARGIPIETSVIEVGARAIQTMIQAIEPKAMVTLGIKILTIAAKVKDILTADPAIEIETPAIAKRFQRRIEAARNDRAEIIGKRIGAIAISRRTLQRTFVQRLRRRIDRLSLPLILNSCPRQVFQFQS